MTAMSSFSFLQKIKDMDPATVILGVEKTSAILGVCLVLYIKLSDVRKSFNAIDSQEKIKKTENLILGAEKIAAIFCTFFALYSAYFLINRPVIQWAVIGSALILNPKDTLNILTAVGAISGLVNFGIFSFFHREDDQQVLKFAELVKERVKREGLVLTHSVFGIDYRLKEIMKQMADDFRASEQGKQFERTGKFLIPVIRGLGISVLGLINTDFNVENWSFYSLDSKMVEIAKRSAPYISSVIAPLFS
jgi:hypothetical protein